MPSHDIPPDLLPYLKGEKTDYSTNQNSIISINIAVIIVATLTTSLRFYVRFYVLRSPGFDDRTFCLKLFISAT
jgi:hypothetical protein